MSPMTEPLQNLKHEHRVIERALRALEGLCLRLEWGASVPASALGQFVEFITDFANRFHHGKEEEYLFPVLERRGLLLKNDSLAAFHREHQIERELTLQMQLAVAEYENVEPESRQHFVEAASRYTNHMIKHIRAEDSILFRLANEVLDDDDRSDLRDGFKRAERWLGPRTQEEFELIATQLEESWTV